MSNKVRAVFISSTFDDLKNHRRKIWDLLESYEVNILGMERFGARKDSPLVTCLTEVEQCDVFLCIIAFRLGSIDDSSGKSFTQREYERACELDKDILIYIADEIDTKISPQYMDHDENRQKLISFKNILKERHTIDTFISEDDLEQKVRIKFDELLASKQELGSTEKDEYLKSKELIDKFLLLPKTYSGYQVKLQIDFNGEPFSASKLLCESFNLDYGETIGIPIRIRNPKGFERSIPYLFLDDEEDITKYFALKDKNNIEILGKLQFSPREINQIRAQFIRREYYEVETSYAITASIPQNILGEKKIIEPDGTIIIKLIEIL